MEINKWLLGKLKTKFKECYLVFKKKLLWHTYRNVQLKWNLIIFLLPSYFVLLLLKTLIGLITLSFGKTHIYLKLISYQSSNTTIEWSLDNQGELSNIHRSSLMIKICYSCTVTLVGLIETSFEFVEW